MNTNLINSDGREQEWRSMCFISVTPTGHNKTPQPRGANKSFGQLINYSTAKRQNVTKKLFPCTLNDSFKEVYIVTSYAWSYTILEPHTFEKS